VTCICSAREHCCETVPRFIHRVRGFRAMCEWYVADAIEGCILRAPTLEEMLAMGWGASQ